MGEKVIKSAELGKWNYDHLVTVSEDGSRFPTHEQIVISTLCVIRDTLNRISSRLLTIDLTLIRIRDAVVPKKPKTGSVIPFKRKGVIRRTRG